MAILGVAVVLSAAPGETNPILARINAARQLRDLPPIHLSAALSRFAQIRVNALQGDALDFDTLDGPELLSKLNANGVQAWYALELAAVGTEDPSAIVEQWSERLRDGDGFFRHEVQEAGIGFGTLEDESLVIAVLAVPPSSDRLRKRLPGVAPREWLTADLTKRLNERRTGLGLGSIERKSDLDRIAETTSARVLEDTGLDGAGMIAVEGSGAVALYYKGKALNVSKPDLAARTWFETFRVPLTRRGTLEAGVGLSSCERGGRLEAVWVVVLSSTSKP